MRYSEPAPAKLNLALHVRGRVPDGRHRLETIFAFCTDGDQLEGEVAEKLSLEIEGPFADALPVDNNLVLKAAEALREAAGRVGDWRRVGRCGGGAAAFDPVVGHRSGPCQRHRPGDRIGRPRLLAQHDRARRRGRR